MKTKSLFLLGSTGSVGINTLSSIDFINVVSREGITPAYRVVGLVAGNNFAELIRQIEKHSPKVAFISDSKWAQRIRKIFEDVNIFSGSDGILEAMDSVEFDFCVNALVGSCGIAPTLKAIEKKATIALANKETLVIGGDLVKQKAKENNVEIIPVDSEHAAIQKILQGIDMKEVEKIILTASGGPFFFKTDISNPSVEEALNHPTWEMGKKITIDSSTMINKGFEIIEAHHLFDIGYDKIEAIIHPQSIIHSMVETIDGELYAQLGRADMKHPIINALTYPKIITNRLPKLSLWQMKDLSFHKPDYIRFPMLKLAYECGEKSGSAPVVLNAANEACVQLFLDRKIAYKDIYRLTLKSIEEHNFIENPSLEQILTLDRQIKENLIPN